MPYPDGMPFDAIEKWWGSETDISPEDAAEIETYQAKMNELRMLLEFFKDDLSELELDEDIWDLLNDSLVAMKNDAMRRAEEALEPDWDAIRDAKRDNEEFFSRSPDSGTAER